MAGIGDFVKMAVGQLGIEEGSAKAGAGALLGALRDSVGTEVFAKVEQAIPDAGTVASAAPAAEGGGGLGGILGQAAGALGGGAGGSLGLGGALAQAGIGADKLGSFASLFATFLKDKLPTDLASGVLGKFRGLSGLLG